MKLQPVYSQIVTAADMLKSTIRTSELISFLQQENAKAAAITNSKLYGLLPFWRALKETSIHPVIGLTGRVEFSTEDIRPIVLYAQNITGYQNLLKITSSTSLQIIFGRTLVYKLPILIIIKSAFFIASRASCDTFGSFL